jgi:hypothetical protein
MNLGGPFSTRCKAALGVFVLAMGLAFLSCAPLFAQGTAGRILGTVTDQSGGAIADATVIVTDVDRNVPRTLTTDPSGAYNAPNLLPGNYKVHVEAKGFRAIERTGIILDVNAELRVDLTLQPGEVSQTITVNESVPMVETTNAELGATLQSNIIEDIPLNGRNFENLLQLNPGVTIYPGGAGMTQSANGLRPRDNVYMINGINATDPWMGQSVFNAVGAAGDAGTILPMDAIDEFKTEQNPRAQYGWKPGAIVNVGIKSGTNDLHGTAYAYGRDTVFDARNYFNPDNVSTFNSTKQPVNLEQFGGTLGGAIKKDKLFYFVNFESQRYGIGNPSVIPTPTQSGPSGLIAACEAALAAPAPAGSNQPNGLAPLSAALAGLTVTGTTCAADPTKLTRDASGLQFQGLFPVDTTGSVASDLINDSAIYGGLGKVNYHVNDKNSLEGMWFMSQGDTTSDDTPPAETSANWITAQHFRSEAASGDWVYTPNSTVVNEVRFGYAHYYQTFYGTDASQNAADYNFNGNTYEFPTGISPNGPGGVNYGGSPGIRFKGGFYNNSANDGIGVGWPKIIGPDGVLNLLDNVSILKGKHSFKFGGEMLSNTSTTAETANAKGILRFSSLTNFMEGNLNQARVFLGDPVVNLYNYGFAGFLQDDWRIAPRLTLNLGLRYELNTVVHERNGKMGNFDPTLGIYQTNNPYNGDHNNFAPRVGFAWDIFGNGKTVLRGGAGILYEEFAFDVMNGEGNLLGLRTFPTGLPLFNAGSTTPLQTTGNIQLQSLTFSPGAPLSLISNAWQNFNPTAQVPGQTTLFSGVSSPACGDGFTQPPTGYTAPPGPCEIYGVNPNLRTPYVNEWSLDLQRAITNNLSLDVAYVGNHGTKLLGKLDMNQPVPGAGWTSAAKAACVTDFTGGNAGNCFNELDTNAEQAAEPFTAPCAGNIYVNGTPGVGPTLGTNGSGGPFNSANRCLSYLSYITMINNIYDSNYNGMQVTLTGRNYHGLSFTAAYSYSHALGMASDQGTAADFPIPENSYGNLRQQLYANTDFDIRHRFTLTMDYNLPGRKGFGQMLEGWSIESTVLLTSGLPWGASDLTDDFSGTNVIGTNAQAFGEPWNFYGNPSDFTPVHGWSDTNGGWTAGGGGVPCFGFGNPNCGATIPQACVNADMTHFSGQQQQLALASLNALGCYMVGNSVMVPPAFGSYGNMKANIFRDDGFRDWDLAVMKAVAITERFKAEFRVEGFNILNHVNFSNPSGGPGGAIQDPSGQPFGFVGLTPDAYSSNPQLGSGGERAFQLGLKLVW